MMLKHPAMRRVLLAFLLLAASACTSNAARTTETSGSTPGSRPAPTPGSRPAPTAATSRSGMVYAAVVHQLVEVDHGYGNAPSPYRRVYVIDGAVPHASKLPGSTGFRQAARPFDADVKAQIIQQLDEEAPPLTFVRSRSQVIASHGSRSPGEVIHGGVLVTLGPVTWINGGFARVGTSSWAAGKDGQWLVYNIKLRHGHWRVVGYHGGITLS
jgi:hypothetical protein